MSTQSRRDVHFKVDFLSTPLYIKTLLKTTANTTREVMGNPRKIHWNEARLAEVTPLYENGGESIGKLLVHRPDLEPEIWKLVSGIGVWRRWHLKAFKKMYTERNLAKSKQAQKKYYRRKRRARQERERRLAAPAQRLERIERQQVVDGEED